MQSFCPSCAAPIETADDHEQRKLICPKCGIEFAPAPAPDADADQTRTAVYGRETHVDRTGADIADRLSIGRFQIVGEVGRGSFGAVYKAFDTELHRLVAVKVPRRGEWGSPEEQQRFLREARSASQLHHPAIVPIFDMGACDGLPYLVCELVEGSSLDTLLAARRFSFHDSARIVAALADGLQAAHQSGIVHRDVKPSNIMIDGDGKPRIMDFGLARQAEFDATLTGDEQVLGTPAYMSPEQAGGGSHGVDRRSDIYSLGIVFYELLTGERAFRGQAQMVMQQVANDDPHNPRSLNNDIPVDLETICLKSIDKDPERRYQTAEELGDDLRRWLRSEPIRARRTGRFGRFSRWCRRNPSLAAMTGLAVLLLVAIAVGSTAASMSIASAHVEQKQAREKEKVATAAAAVSADDARRAVEQYYTLTAVNPLLDDPGSQPLLREILATAIDYCERFLSQYGDRPELAAESAATYVRLAQLQLARGETDTATATMEQAVRRLERFLPTRPTPAQLRPLSAGLFRFPRYVHRRGAVSPSDPGRSLRVMNRCLAIWDQLVAEHPDVPSYDFDRAGMYYYLDLAYRATTGRTGANRPIEKSIETLTRLVKKYPENQTYQRELSRLSSVYGEAYGDALGGLDKQLEIQRRAIEIDPRNPRPYHRIAELLATFPDSRLRDPPRAIEMARRAIALEPRNAQYWHTLGVAQFRAGQVQKAIDSIDNSMLLQNGGDGQDWYYMALAAWRQGDRKNAHDYYSRAEAWKVKERVGADELHGIDQECARLFAAEPRASARDEAAPGRSGLPDKPALSH